VGPLSSAGNLFLTNFHRLLDNEKAPNAEDPDATDYFLGKRPPAGGRGGPDLREALREVRELVVMNDEAHHIHDPGLAWFQSLRDIAGQVRLNGGELSAQFDLTATPKHEGVPETHFQIEYQNASGGISNYIPDFVVRETEADYWVVETKGREDLDDPLKWERLKQWCKDATLRDAPRKYHPLFVREDALVKYQPRTFRDLKRTCEEHPGE